MEHKLYVILLIYFLLGGLIMARVNRNKAPAYKKKNWLKYFVYLLIVNTLFISILFWPLLFHTLCLLILTLGFYELLALVSPFKKVKLGLATLMVYAGLAFFFYHFSLLPARYLFYTLFLTTIFDAFSQLSGQLFGKRKLAPRISPNKTYEGLFGGLFFALFTAMIIHELLSLSVGQSFLLGIGLTATALLGDLLASFCKRRFNTKDFSRLIPGHGGVLDRFDSFIVAGSFMLLITKILHM